MRTRSGIDVRVDSIYCANFLINIIEGRPDWIYKTVIAEAPERARELWGDRPVHVLEPPPLTDNANLRDLPRWTVYVWLSSGPITQQGDYSELVIVLFCNQALSQPPNILIEPYVLELDWVSLAQDCAI